MADTSKVKYAFFVFKKLCALDAVCGRPSYNDKEHKHFALKYGNI